jgi:hypothetical protein
VIRTIVNDARVAAGGEARARSRWLVPIASVVHLLLMVVILLVADIQAAIAQRSGRSSLVVCSAILL